MRVEIPDPAETEPDRPIYLFFNFYYLYW
jgi:hypothetical protein